MDLEKKIAFSMIRGLNISLGNSLLERVGTEDDFFRLPAPELKLLSRLKEDIVTDSYRQKLREKAREEYKFLYANDIHTHYFRDDNFPKRLLDTPDGPALIYRLGDGVLDTKYTVGIVGTRHATAVGCKITEDIVKDLATALGRDVTIISGLAYGIDVAAHKAALKENIPTIAVLAHPLNSIYPADHRGVAVQIVKEGGALITEYPTSAKVHQAYFLARNRIIAGLSDVVIVVESDYRGGAMTTARIASDYNREVMAVPGRLTDKYSNGTNRLIASQRAMMFTDTDSLLDTMGWTKKEYPSTESKLILNLTERQQEVLDYITEHPDLTVNDLVRQMQIPYSRISETIFELEMADYIISLPGGRYAPLTT